MLFFRTIQRNRRSLEKNDFEQICLTSFLPGWGRLTSGTRLNRLLDPKSDVALASLQSAAATVGRRVSIELV